MFVLARITVELAAPKSSETGGIALAFVFVALVGAFILLQALNNAETIRRHAGDVVSAIRARLSSVQVDEVSSRPRVFERKGSHKRRWERRGGQAVPVIVDRAIKNKPVLHGAVLNRSRGGVLLALPVLVAQGTKLRLLPTEAPGSMDWLEVEVRHCRSQNDQWLAGCAFTNNLNLTELTSLG